MLWSTCKRRVSLPTKTRGSSCVDFVLLVSLASMRKRGSSLAPGILLRVGEVLNARAMRPAVPSNALHFAGAPWRYAVGDGGGQKPLLFEC